MSLNSKVWQQLLSPLCRRVRHHSASIGRRLLIQEHSSASPVGRIVERRQFSARGAESLRALPGVSPLPGERLANLDGEEKQGVEIWHKLAPDIQASLLQPRPDETIGFKGWVGEKNSQKLVTSDYKEKAGIYKLFTSKEAKALIELTASEEGEFTPSKEDTAKKYTGRFNTLRQAVHDRWLSAALWQRLSRNAGGLVNMEYWSKIVGANSSLRLVRTQPPIGDERPGQHLKHVDTREDNRDFVDATNPELYTRVSVITVQCYLNPEEHDGGEFVLWPARLNLADPTNKKDTILYEQIPESNPDLISVKIPMNNGECVVFHQESDQLYHGGAPVTGDKDKIAVRFVLDMQKSAIDVDNIVEFYKEPEYGMGFTNDLTSIVQDRVAGRGRNTINCVERTRQV